MNKRQSLVYAQTSQTLEFFPPQWAKGVPTGTPTYSIWQALDSNDNTVELSGNASIDSVSTAVDVDSGYSQENRRRLYISSTSGIVRGRAYVLANTNGERELVIPEAIASNDYLDLEADLAYDYPASTSTLKGYRIYFSPSDSWTGDESKINSHVYPYRARVSYSIDIDYQGWLEFDLVRQAKSYSLNVNDLAEIWPDLRNSEWREQHGQGFAKQIDAAFERLEFDSRLHGVDLNQLRSAQLFDELMRSAAVWLIARAGGPAPGGREPTEFLADAKKQYQDDFMQAIGVLKLNVDQGKEGAITEAPFRQPVFRR